MPAAETRTNSGLVTPTQRRTARLYNLRLPYPCTQTQADALIANARAEHDTALDRAYQQMRDDEAAEEYRRYMDDPERELEARSA